MLNSFLRICGLSVCASALFGQISITNASLPSGSLNQLYYAQLQSDGVLPVQWSMVQGNGSLPPGLSLSASGLLGGTPSAAGTYSFKVGVRDNTGATAQSQLSLTITAITVTTFYLPISVVDTPYSVQLKATGGSGGPYQWFYYNRGTTAPWTPSSGNFTAGQDGVISGTATDSDQQFGVGNFDVVAFDPATQQRSAPMNLSLSVTDCPVTVSPSSLPNGEVGVNYSANFSFSAQIAMPGQNLCVAQSYYQTQVLTQKTIPPGLSVSAKGMVTGVPQIAGPYQFPADVNLFGYFSNATESGTVFAMGQFPISFTVLPAPSITTSSLPPGIVGAPYGPVKLDITGGTPPYALTVGGVPPGLLMTSDGTLSGTPTTPGSFSISVGVSDSVGGKSQPYPQTFPMTIAAATPQLQVLSSGLNFTAPANGGAPPPQSIPVTPANGAALPDNFQIATDGGAAGTPAPSWLSVNTAVASAPSEIFVNVNQANLPTGNYSGRVLTIDSNGIRTAIPITLAVTNVPPKLSVAPGMVQLPAREDAPGMLAQSIIVSNSGGGGQASFTASVAPGASWLSFEGGQNLTSLTTPAVLPLQVNTQGLAVGGYAASVLLTSPAGNVTVPISLFVAQSGAGLGLNMSSALFQISQGASSSGMQNIEVLNVGDPNSTVNWSASVITQSSWLTLDSATGTATTTNPGTLTLGLAPSAAQLLPGLYYALVKISDPNSLNSIQYVTALLDVEANSSASPLDLSPAGLYFHVSAGGTPPPAQQVELTRNGTNSVQISSDSAWLAGNAGTDVLTVTANPAGLASGVYSGNIYISTGVTLRSLSVSFVVQPAEGACTPGKLVLTEYRLGNYFSFATGLPVLLSAQLHDDCGEPITNGSVVATFSNGDAPVQLAADSFGSYFATWQPSAVTANAVVTLNATSGALAPATTNLYGAVIASQVPAPIIVPGGTLNNLNPVVGAPLAPGTIAQVYGSSLASSTLSPSTLPLPTSLGNTFALVGSEQAPLYFLSNGQVNIQIPNDAAPSQQTPIVFSVGNALTLPLILDIVPTAPGVLSANDGPTPPSVQNGAHLIAQHLDGSLVSDSAPAKPGEYLVMYAVGLGATDPSVPSGAPTPNVPLHSVTVQPTVTVGSQPATVAFAGLTPGFVGLYQINFQVPATATSGTLEVDVIQNSVAANPTILPVSE